MSICTPLQSVSRHLYHTYIYIYIYSTSVVFLNSGVLVLICCTSVTSAHIWIRFGGNRARSHCKGEQQCVPKWLVDKSTHSGMLAAMQLIDFIDQQIGFPWICVYSKSAPLGYLSCWFFLQAGRRTKSICASWNPSLHPADSAEVVSAMVAVSPPPIQCDPWAMSKDDGVSSNHGLMNQ